MTFYVEPPGNYHTEAVRPKEIYMHYYQFNIGDYASHTRHLSPLEDIAYRRLLDQAYTTELPITKDLHTLCRKIDMREYQQEVDDVLHEFFIEVDDGWINNRVCKEIARTGEKSGKAKHAAAVRWDSERKAKALQMECERNAGASKNDATHNPLPITHYPLPITQNPEPKTKDKNKTSSAVPADAGTQNACRETWGAYGSAYFTRYGTEPVRNAKVSAQIKQFVARIGADESPKVAAHFVESNAQFYVSKGHAVGLMLADAEKLRTEWATGRTMTATRARQIDRSQANYSVVDEALALMAADNNA